MSAATLSAWFQAQELKGPGMRDASVFYKNLEKRLDIRRAEQGLLVLRGRRDVVDFSSNDFLSLASSGLLRTAFFEELARHPGFQLGSTGSRLLDGNNTYIETIEQEIADFHGAETAIIFNSGYEANGAILSTVPQPGDVIVYDELIHASVHDGMKHSDASLKVSFGHNDPDSFLDVLMSVKESHPLIRKGERTVLISIETVYSMDGDVAPVKEFVQIAKDLFPKGNAQFIIDEAHSTGVIGPHGAGLVAALGLEKEMAIRMHTFGKALASHGAVILTSHTVRTMLINYARPLIYTTAPSFPMLAAIRAGYTLMKSGVTQEAQDKVQGLVRHFFMTLAVNPVWIAAEQAGIVSIPVSQGWESQPFVTHIVPIWTRPRYNYFLCFHLQLADFNAWAIDAPVVPKGTGRVRLVFHAANTNAQVEKLISLICGWAQEMLDIEAGPRTGEQIPSAARRIFCSLGGAQEDEVAETVPEDVSAADIPRPQPKLPPVGQITSAAADTPVKDTTEVGVPKIRAMLEAYRFGEKAGEAGVHVAEVVS